MEELTLTTTGGRLWDLVHRPVAESLAQLDNGYEFRVGGGTTLAARWKHRDSFDIDLAVSSDANLRDLRDPANPFQDTMRALGGNPQYVGRQWRVGFPAGELDLGELDPSPPGSERRALVNGTPALVLSNAQILQGKLDRADKNPVRDVFDFIKAAALDPQALATAVNCRTRYDIEVIAITWERTDATLEHEATDQLRGVPKEMAEDPRTLGTDAAKAVRGAVYRHISVGTDGDQAVGGNAARLAKASHTARPAGLSVRRAPSSLTAFPGSEWDSVETVRKHKGVQGHRPIAVHLRLHESGEHDADGFQAIRVQLAPESSPANHQESRAFIGGADIRELAELTPETTHAFISRLHLACAAIRRLQVPVIARIHGYCLGAGVEIAASCNLRVAGQSATFGMPEVKVGIPSVIEAALLHGLIGAGRTRELVYTGEPITATEAERCGLVERVVPDHRARRGDPEVGGRHRRRRPRRHPAAEGAGAAVGDAAARSRHPGRHPLVHDRLPHRRASPAHAGVSRPEATVAPAVAPQAAAGDTSDTHRTNRRDGDGDEGAEVGKQPGAAVHEVHAGGSPDQGGRFGAGVSREGRITVEPVSRVRGRHDLRALATKMPRGYAVDELDCGMPVGREAW